MFEENKIPGIHTTLTVLGLIEIGEKMRKEQGEKGS